MLRARRLVLGSGLLALAAACGAPPSAPAPAKAAGPDPNARCAVWVRELSFAAAVAAHDEAAFAEHVHPQAMFVEGEQGTTRGRAAIVADWKPILLGQPLALRWHPTSVVVAEGAGAAVSRGPYLLEDTRPNAPTRYRKGFFQSVWVKDADGAWRVLVDGNTPPPIAISSEEAARLESELHAPCAPPGAAPSAAPSP